MAEKSRQDIVVPPDNYSAVERQMLRLRAIPAMMDAELHIARKFAEAETTGIFDGDPGPEIAAEQRRQDAMWRDYGSRGTAKTTGVSRFLALLDKLFHRRRR